MEAGNVEAVELAQRERQTVRREDLLTLDKVWNHRDAVDVGCWARYAQRARAEDEEAAAGLVGLFGAQPVRLAHAAHPLAQATLAGALVSLDNHIPAVDMSN